MKILSFPEFLNERVGKSLFDEFMTDFAKQVQKTYRGMKLEDVKISITNNRDNMEQLKNFDTYIDFLSKNFIVDKLFVTPKKDFMGFKKDIKFKANVPMQSSYRVYEIADIMIKEFKELRELEKKSGVGQTRDFIDITDIVSFWIDMVLSGKTKIYNIL